MNSYLSQAVVFGQAFANTIVAALKTVPGGALIVSGKIRLSTDPAYNPTPGSTIAALDANEANYSGYAAGGIAVSLSGPVNLSAIIQGCVASGLFEATTASPFVPNTIYGYWIDDGTNFIMGERFAGGGQALFGSPGDFLALEVAFPVGLMQPAA